MILVVVEHEGGTLDRLSSEALTLGRAPRRGDRRPAPRRRLGRGRRGRPPVRSGAAGVAAVHDDRRTLASRTTPPRRSAQALAQLIERDAPAAVIGTGSERGAEIMAHVAARLGLPLAANVTEVRAGRSVAGHPPALGRQPARGGSARRPDPPPDGRPARRSRRRRGRAAPRPSPSSRSRPT